MPKIKKISFILSVLLMSFLVGYIAFAWTDPTHAPPGGNVDAPLHVGSLGQRKLGDLRIVGFRTDSHTWLATDGGNVGIGTINPRALLDVAGDIAITKDGPVAFISDHPSAAKGILSGGYPDPYENVGLFGRIDTGESEGYLIGAFHDSSQGFHGLRIGVPGGYHGQLGFSWDWGSSDNMLEKREGGPSGGTGMSWKDGYVRLYSFGEMVTHIGSWYGGSTLRPPGLVSYISLGANKSLRFSPGGPGDDVSNDDFHIYRDSLDNRLQFLAGPNLLMALTTAGNLGIGTTIPAERLHVAGRVRLGADPVHDMDAVTKRYVDAQSGGGSELKVVKNVIGGAGNTAVCDCGSGWIVIKAGCAHQTGLDNARELAAINYRGHFMEGSISGSATCSGGLFACIGSQSCTRVAGEGRYAACMVLCTR